MTLADRLADETLEHIYGCIGKTLPSRLRKVAAEFQREAIRLGMVEVIDKVIEECAKTCENKRVGAETAYEPSNHLYNAAIGHAAHAIRALKEKA